MNSIWMRQPDASAYPALQGELEVDAVVIGAGITGVTTALCLHDAGLRVALIEAGRIGASNTGGSTGNLYGTLSSGLAPLRERWDDATLRAVAAMRMRAVERIEGTVARFAIDCGFSRQPLHTGITEQASAQALASLEAEFDATRAAGLEPAWAEPPLPMKLRRALRIDGQAQFNPYLYTRALAAALAARGVRVHERSAAIEIDAGEGCVRTDDGEVRAKHIVFATHTPKGFNLVQAEMEVYREYGIATPLATAAMPDGIFWLRDRQRSLRNVGDGRRGCLVVVGEKHKTGHPPGHPDVHRNLFDDARDWFGADAVECAWSAQQYRSADGLPYIGPSAHRNVHVATGFGADGLTWGTVAAQVIAELIQGRESADAELLTPRRFTPARSARVWAAENTMVVKHLVGDRLSQAQVQTLEAVKPGEGHIVELDGSKFAVHRDGHGKLTVLSPVCPHLKCHVAWNRHAHSWDCPCHGSRFGIGGEVIEGPALDPLRRYEMG